MKLLRVGNKGTEKPAVLDKNGKIRDISSHIKDLNPDNLNFESILKLKNIIPLKINENILRSETAAISIISIVTFNLLS